jgi:hypothetical protein
MLAPPPTNARTTSTEYDFPPTPMLPATYPAPAARGLQGPPPLLGSRRGQPERPGAGATACVAAYNRRMLALLARRVPVGCPPATDVTPAWPNDASRFSPRCTPVHQLSNYRHLQGYLASSGPVVQLQEEPKEIRQFPACLPPHPPADARLTNANPRGRGPIGSLRPFAHKPPIAFGVLSRKISFAGRFDTDLVVTDRPEKLVLSR